MGFGGNYSVRHNRGSKRFDNSQVAHVWNSQTLDAGQSGNGNFYFEGRTLYSYGSHFVVGFIDRNGVAFINRDKHSISTAGHQSDARQAVRNRDVFHVADLTEIRDLLVYLSSDREVSSDVRKQWQATGRRLLAKHYVALQSRRFHAEDYRGWWNDATTPGEEAGAYLARLLGLPAASWGKIKRDAAAAAAKAESDAEASAAKRAIDRALWLADMSVTRWNRWEGEAAAEYSSHGLALRLKELKRARGLMLKATRGKLASKSRLATIRERIKRTAAAIAQFNSRRDAAGKRQVLARNIGYVKNWRDANPELRGETTTWATMRDVASAAEYLARYGRTSALKASALALQAGALLGQKLIESENHRRNEEARRRREEERQARDAQRVLDIAAWYRGENVRVSGFDAASGGAALRVVGDTLETSWGANVPLAHAVKAFRFLKLVRERGAGWQANGKTIHVGHFRVDRIAPSGDFTAGCHNFTWPEVERVAIAAGVFDCPASDSALVANA